MSRAFLRPAVLGLLTLVLAGCGGATPAASRPAAKPIATTGAVTTADHAVKKPMNRPPTDAELRWSGKVSEWGSGLALVLRRAQRLQSLPGRKAELRATLHKVAACPRTFRSAVGNAPTARLRAAERKVLAACAHFRKAVILDPSSAAGGKAADEVLQAGELMGEVVKQLVLFQPALARALPTRDGVQTVSRIEPRFSGVASSLAGKKTEVRCWSRADWRQIVHQMYVYTGGRFDSRVEGFSSPDRRRIHLSPLVCSSLDALVYRHARPAAGKAEADASFAVIALAHEAQHRRGIEAEAVAQCYGMQEARQAAIALGIDRAYAVRLPQLFWRQLYRLAPAEYKSPQCRNGGRLDVHPQSSVWP